VFFFRLLPARAAPRLELCRGFSERCRHGCSRPGGGGTTRHGTGSLFDAPRRALTLRASRVDAGREPTLPSRTLFPRRTGSRTRRDESPSSSSPPASSWGNHRPLRCPSPRPGGEGAAGCVRERGGLVSKKMIKNIHPISGRHRAGIWEELLAKGSRSQCCSFRTGHLPPANTRTGKP